MTCVTGPLTPVQLLEEVPEIVKLLASNGIDNLVVEYGWGCKLDPGELWQDIEVRLPDLPAFIQGSIEKGIYSPGQAETVLQLLHSFGGDELARPETYELLIAVEDFWFDADDAREVSGFIEREVLTLPLEFDAVHSVGKTERLFLTFPLARATCRPAAMALPSDCERPITRFSNRWKMLYARTAGIATSGVTPTIVLIGSSAPRSKVWPIGSCPGKKVLMKVSLTMAAPGEVSSGRNSRPGAPQRARSPQREPRSSPGTDRRGRASCMHTSTSVIAC